jgi:hypothetical protein
MMDPKSASGLVCWKCGVPSRNGADGRVNAELQTKMNRFQISCFFAFPATLR